MEESDLTHSEDESVDNDGTHEPDTSTDSESSDYYEEPEVVRRSEGERKQRVMLLT